VESVVTLVSDSGSALAASDDRATAPLSSAEKLLRMAQASGDISEIYTPAKLAEIGETAVTAYERDLADRKEWEDTAREALDACSQEQQQKAKDFPWPNAANMRWPLLTIAAMQFNARMYPAVVKGDEAVLCKIIGSDNGKPKMGTNPMSGAVQPVPLMGQDGKPVLDGSGQPQFDWLIPPGAKAKRARRVADYLNTTIFYRMDNWEDDTDALLMQLPATGCVFRKTWYSEGAKTATISALDLVVPVTARNLKTTPRITEKIRDVFPHEIIEKQRTGYYRTIDLGIPKKPDGSENRDGTRLLLEQHCLWDFDDDGLPEPYIVTVDHQTRLVLRIEPNFGPNDIEWNADQSAAVSIRRRDFYVKYGMFPHPGGKFYDQGLGHLLKRLGDGIDTMLNQLIDAGTAQTAGGGFIGSGVRLQSRGGGGRIRFAPGEWKTIDVSGDTLRANMVEKTLPDVSPVTFQLLDLILGAAKDIAGIKDVMTGEASNTGQVGTTLALIEQGLQVFNATAKRVFRSLKSDFELLFENISRYGGAAAAKDYADVLDDPEADFGKDFSLGGLDIRPVSDPSSITRMQKMAKAQFILGLLPQIVSMGGDGKEVLTRVLEAVDTEDIDKIFPPKQSNPMEDQVRMQMLLENLRLLGSTADEKNASAQSKMAKAMLDAVKAQQGRFDLSTAAGQHGMEMGAHAAALEAPQ